MTAPRLRSPRSNNPGQRENGEDPEGGDQGQLPGREDGGDEATQEIHKLQWSAGGPVLVIQPRMVDLSASGEGRVKIMEVAREYQRHQELPSAVGNREVGTFGEESMQHAFTMSSIKPTEGHHRLTLIERPWDSDSKAAD